MPFRKQVGWSVVLAKRARSEGRENCLLQMLFPGITNTVATDVVGAQHKMDNSMAYAIKTLLVMVLPLLQQKKKQQPKRACNAPGHRNMCTEVGPQAEQCPVLSLSPHKPSYIDTTLNLSSLAQSIGSIVPQLIT